MMTALQLANICNNVISFLAYANFFISTKPKVKAMLALPSDQILRFFFYFLLLIWQNVEPTLANLLHHWPSFHWCKWPNIEKQSKHLVALIRSKRDKAVVNIIHEIVSVIAKGFVLLVPEHFCPHPKSFSFTISQCLALVNSVTRRLTKKLPNFHQKLPKTAKVNFYLKNICFSKQPQKLSNIWDNFEEFFQPRAF